MNFNEEATLLVKAILEEGKENNGFAKAVTILEDYLTDLDTHYKGLLENAEVSN